MGKPFPKYVERELYPQAFRHTEGKAGRAFSRPEEALVGAMTFCIRATRAPVYFIRVRQPAHMGRLLGKGHILQLIGLSIITFYCFTLNRLGSLCFADGLGHMAVWRSRSEKGMPPCAAVRSWAAARSSYWAGRSMNARCPSESAHKLRALHARSADGLEPPSVYEMALREIRVSGRYGHRLALGMAISITSRPSTIPMGTRPVMPYSVASHKLSGRKNVRKSDMVFGRIHFSFPTHDAEEASACWRHCAGRVRNPLSVSDGTIRFTAKLGGFIRSGRRRMPGCWIRLSATQMRRCMFQGKGRNRFPPTRDADKA